MKYGSLSHGNVNIDNTKRSLIAKGDSSERPAGEDGQIRYNTDVEVVGLGKNDGFGRFEMFKNGDWVSLITENDLESSDDQEGKTDINDNIMFRKIADQLRDTFAQAVGTLELIQSGSMPQWFGQGGTVPASAPGNVRTASGTAPNNLPPYLNALQMRFALNAAPTAFGPRNPNTGSLWHAVPYGNNRGDTWQRATGGGSLDAAFKPVLGNGKLYNVSMFNKGSGYNANEPPTVSLTTNGGTGAIIKPIIVSGIMTRVDIIAGGTGYRKAHTRIYLKGGGYRNIAECRPVIDSNGTIISATVQAQGDGYQSEPQAIVSDGGYGGVLEANVDSLGRVGSITIANPGFDYTVTPTITITSPGTGTTATATTSIGTGKVLDVILLKPVTSQTMANGLVPITITGDGTNAQANLVIVNNVGTGVQMVNEGTGYSWAFGSVPPGQFTSTTGVDFQQHEHPNVILDFTFDVFNACGIPDGERSKYDVSLMSNIYKMIPFGAPYAGQPVAMGVKFTPTWAPFNNFNHANYGIYAGNMSLFGQRSYYTSAVGGSWMANLVKTRQ